MTRTTILLPATEISNWAINLPSVNWECIALFPGDFIKGDGIYEDLTDFKSLKMFVENQLEDYNMEPGIISMDLVLFKDAIEHG